MSEVFLDQIDSVWRVSLILVNIGLAWIWRRRSSQSSETVTVEIENSISAFVHVCDRSIPVPAERLANQFTVLPVSGVPEAAAGNPLINTFDASCYFCHLKTARSRMRRPPLEVILRPSVIQV